MLFLSLALSVVAALSYGFASVLQARAAQDVPAASGPSASILVRLVVRWQYLCGIGLDLVGFGAAVVALRALPLFVVQAATAGSVGVTALGAHYLLGDRLQRRDRVALALLVVGLVLLGGTGQSEHAKPLVEPGPALLLAAAPLIALGAAFMIRSTAAWSAVGLAVGAGASFGAVGLAARAFETPHHLSAVATSPLTYAIVLHGAAGVTLFAAALQRGDVTVVAAVTFAVETVGPAAIGLAVLGDHARPGLLPVAVAGFGLTLASSIALARHASPTPVAPTTR